MIAETMKDYGEFPEELPHGFVFPEEYISPGADTPYKKECADRAGKALFFRVEDMPVVELFSSDGTYSYTYGYKDGKWDMNFPGNETFYNEGSKISRAEFLALL
jgi:hypothetical protein